MNFFPRTKPTMMDTFLPMVLALSMQVAITARDNIAMAQYTTYTKSQYDSLGKRWAPQDVKAVVQYLRYGVRLKPNSSFYSDSVGQIRDFRGIDIEDSVIIKDTIARMIRLRDAHLEGAKIAHLDCRGADLQGIQFTDAILDSGLFEGANLQKASFAGAYLQGARFKRAHLDSACFRLATLTGAHLDTATLDFARLDNADLSYASFKMSDLSYAELDTATCMYADFRGCRLHETHMIRTKLYYANLERAEFFGAILRGACLSAATVRDADFFHAQFDTTQVQFTKLDEAKIRYIVWGDNLHRRYYTGDEEELDTLTGARRASSEQIVEDTYRDLESYYRKEGLLEIASQFHFRLNEVVTKNYSSWNPLKVLRYVFLQVSYGYGTYPVRLVWWSLIVVLLFTLAFAGITSFPSRSGIYVLKKLADGSMSKTLLRNRGGLLFIDCFYFSLLSFSTLGYGAIKPKQWLEFFRFEPVEFEAIGWARIFVGLEAAVGIFTLALFVTTILGSN